VITFCTINTMLQVYNAFRVHNYCM